MLYETEYLESHFGEKALTDTGKRAATVSVKS